LLNVERKNLSRLQINHFGHSVKRFFLLDSFSRLFIVKLKIKIKMINIDLEAIELSLPINYSSFYNRDEQQLSYELQASTIATLDAFRNLIGAN
jgi:hypothetical protein